MIPKSPGGHRRAKRSYSTFEARRGSHEEIPLVQGKRNPSKMVGVAEGIRGQTHWNHNHRKLVNLITWTTVLSNSMKLSHACGTIQDGRLMVERFDRMWSTGERNGKPLQYSCLENPINSMKSESEVAQSCLILCDPMDCSLLGSSIHGIFQARVLFKGDIQKSN